MKTHKITSKQPCKSCIYTVLELVYKEPSFLVSQTTFSPSSGLLQNQQDFFGMKATASLYVILAAVILALGDGAYLPTDNRGQSHHSMELIIILKKEN